MTTITVTKDDDQTTEFKFDQIQDTITLGRRSTNDVCIPDLSVSGSHATFIINEDSVVLEDLNSTNGTYVNGQVVQRTVINPGDEIIMGKILIGISDLDILAPESSVRASERNHESQTERHSERHAEHDSFEFDNDIEAESESYSHISKSNGQSPAAATHAATQTAASVTNSATNEHRVRESNGAEVLEREPSDRSAAASSARAFVPDSEPELDSEADHKIPLHNDNSSKEPAHPLDGLEHLVVPDSAPDSSPLREVDTPVTSANNSTKGAVIEIKNGAKSGQILPIDKPVTTLGRPGIQIAAIMRKPHGYYLMHIESNEECEQPTLNSSPIGDEPVPLHSGDELTVAGIEVEFMLS